MNEEKFIKYLESKLKYYEEKSNDIWSTESIVINDILRDVICGMFNERK